MKERRNEDYESTKRSENRKMAGTVSLYGLAGETAEIDKKGITKKKRRGNMAVRISFESPGGFSYEVFRFFADLL